MREVASEGLSLGAKGVVRRGIPRVRAGCKRRLLSGVHRVFYLGAIVIAIVIALRNSYDTKKESLCAIVTAVRNSYCTTQ